MAKSKQRKGGGAPTHSAIHLLHRALQRGLDHHAQAAGPGGLTLRQYTLLAAVSAASGSSQSELVKVTGIDRSTLADLVSRLRAKGLLERERSASDARANVVRLSAAGNEALATGAAPAAEADKRLLAPLSPKKRDSLVKLLAALARGVETPAEKRARKAAAGEPKAAPERTPGESPGGGPKQGKRRRRDAPPTA